ncbi:MAG TPA: hypothetical protein VH142_25885 [Polyangiaceae bacterium]|nr:hypothetical protein [Polyangiaceae bacterium]
MVILAPCVRAIVGSAGTLATMMLGGVCLGALIVILSSVTIPVMLVQVVACGGIAPAVMLVEVAGIVVVSAVLSAAIIVVAAIAIVVTSDSSVVVRMGTLALQRLVSRARIHR